MGKLALLIVLLLSITCSCVRPDDTNSTRCAEEERQALLALKHSFGGPYIRRLWSWQGHDCCGWGGVGCDKSTGRVLKLDLRAPTYKVFVEGYYTKYYQNLFYQERESLEAKEVNPSLMKLKYLKHLDLSGNHFNFSSIPHFLGQMKELTYLNLSSAELLGRMPHHLGNLSSLGFLDLSDNDLFVDDFSWASGLSSLQHLDMRNVYLGQVTPKLMEVLTRLPPLLHLDLSYCELNSTQLLSHPSTNSTSLPHALRYLDLSFNQLDGQISCSLQNLTSLEVLDLSSNQLHGQISCSLQNLTSLEVLDLTNNYYFDSSIPLCLGNFNNLESLHLAFNGLSSPDSGIELILRNLSNLRSLDLSVNQLSGIIPSSLGRMVSLSYLDLSSNQFNGIIPSSLERLTSLSFLDMSNNQFTGIMHASLGVLTYLNYLDISFNQLNGVIPILDGRLVSLSFLDLSNNQFSGSIPSTFEKLSALTILNLSYNNLNGTISTSFRHLSNLVRLDLSNNQLHGMIPKFIGQLVNLYWLVLSSNALEGVVTSEHHFANLSFWSFLA